ncbi:PREDICTED: carbohydrate sulfotransferase 12-like [Priapulus caudatus]|uniref:Carbohydrate sulfotransferase n=1 Tax=Priapulus caudatus TaxID=37621 RepID=A0ABM1DSN3_PRICU|nr:PREDICTED: carbohydrate sulfotransferase 12-like [Priapulus caudatus]
MLTSTEWECLPRYNGTLHTVIGLTTHATSYGDANTHSESLISWVAPAAPLADTIDERVALLRHQCAKLERAGVEKSLAEYPYTYMHVFWLPRRKLVYCEVQKVASTTWKNALLALEMAPAGSKADMQQFNRLPLDYVHIDTNVERNLQRVSRIVDLAKMADMLSARTKFLFVRHPLVRLLSAYRDEIAAGSRSEKIHREQIAMIRKHFARSPTNANVGDAVSFVQFLTYVAETPTREYNYH